MEDARDLVSSQQEAVLVDVTALAAAARGDASKLLEAVARIDGLCDRLGGLRMELLRDAELVCDSDLSVAERLHATNRVSRPSSRVDVRLARDLADRFPVIGRAWCDGTLPSQQARAIAVGLKHLPVTLSPPQLEACQRDVSDSRIGWSLTNSAQSPNTWRRSSTRITRKLWKLTVRSVT